MKKIILMLMLLTGFAAIAKAQDTTRAKRTPQERAQHTTKMLQKKAAAYCRPNYPNKCHNCRS
jgi:hypothetical protein